MQSLREGLTPNVTDSSEHRIEIGVSSTDSQKASHADTRHENDQLSSTTPNCSPGTLLLVTAPMSSWASSTANPKPTQKTQPSRNSTTSLANNGKSVGAEEAA
ncbi:uncharacterized protein BJX67DRAFT_360277 [Aspergillus lucknowensis]|uniref:Uncharacterized protein n=1 Tax=Aspergillus lucknowensis TaxID=176173 RepID=A0ABR4LJX3_9EURO